MNRDYIEPLFLTQRGGNAGDAPSMSARRSKAGWPTSDRIVAEIAAAELAVSHEAR